MLNNCLTTSFITKIIASITLQYNKIWGFISYNKTNMKYVYTNKPTEQAAAQTAKTLIDHLSKGERILWLLSGGSSIPIAIIASQSLQNIDLSNLFVSLTDERYGPIGHKDENWQQ